MALAISLALAVLLFFLLVFVVLKMADTKVVHQRLSLFKEEEKPQEEEDPSKPKTPLFQRTVGRAFEKLMSSLSMFAPSAMPGLIEEKIMLAGKQGEWNVKAVVGLWFVSLLAGIAFGFWYTTKGTYSTLQGLLIVWAGTAFGAFLPFGIFNHIIKKRQAAIVYQLPEVLDLLSISVSAGLSLDGALRKVVERMKGPLIDEFARMLRDVRMGMTRRRSMQLMAKRCGVQDIDLFVMSVTQAERLGASMSDTLMIQADNMRHIRTQRARTKAMQAPVKMVFPLVFCIFPAMFVVVLVPSLINLMGTLGK